MGWGEFFAFLALALPLGGGGPVISRPGGSFDAGPVATSKAKTITHTFRVVNTTGVPVRVLDQAHSCLCTTVELEKGATIAPGGEIPLKLTVNVLPAHPDQTVECMVKTDHPTMGDWTYRLTFHPYPDAIIRPDRIDLGVLPRRTTADDSGPREPVAHLELFGNLAERLAPKLNISPLTGARARIGEPLGREMLAGGVARVRYPIFIELADRADVGQHQTALNIQGKGLPPLSTSVSWRILGPLSAAPANLYFGMIRAGRPSDPSAILVKAGDGRSFRVTAVESSSADVTLRSPDPSTSARSHHLSATFRADAASRDKAATGHLLIKTDLDGDAAVKVPYSAFLLPPEREPQKDSPAPTPTREERR